MARRMRKPTVKKLLARNRGVDAAKLKQGQKLISDLAESGLVKTSGYSLDIPYTKQVHTETGRMFHVHNGHTLLLRRQQ